MTQIYLVFQLYRDGQFQWKMTAEYQDKPLTYYKIYHINSYQVHLATNERKSNSTAMVFDTDRKIGVNPTTKRSLPRRHMKSATVPKSY